MKRTYQPNNLRRAKRHGFRHRMSTRAGTRDLEVSPGEGPAAAVGLTGRIRQRATFDRFRSEGRRFRHGVVWCSWVQDAAVTPPQVVHAIGRPVGGAVVRNRVRRRLRAVVAELASSQDLAAGLYLFGVHQGAVDVPFPQLRDDVAQVTSRIRTTATRG